MIKEKGTLIKKIEKGSIAEEVGLESGDIILSIDGEKIEDIFDYNFLITDEQINLLVEKNNTSEIWEILIDKDINEDLGIEFDDPMIDSARSCTNKCIFCFIDQMPKGMRETLYFKDDDTRLSFLSGNYVTLTNMKNKDLDKIIKYHMSPINISVHTTNPELRVKMLRNKNAGNIMERIKRLTAAGIEVNCQIVLCRDVNDKIELDRTIEELSDLWPGVNSISVVPVGITKYREGLTELAPYDKISALKTIEQVAKWQKKLLKSKGSRLVYLSDEFYLMAGYKIPDYLEYEDFPQLQNGVGLIAVFRDEFSTYLQYLKNKKIDDNIKIKASVENYDKNNTQNYDHNNTENYIENSIDKPRRRVSIATGVLAYEFIYGLSKEIEQIFKNIEIKVFPIKNNFFGEYVTVSGLLTGQDIIEQLKHQQLGEKLLISKSMLKADEPIFLDDYSVDTLEKELKTKIYAVENHGKSFINAIIDGGDIL